MSSQTRLPPRRRKRASPNLAKLVIVVTSTTFLLLLARTFDIVSRQELERKSDGRNQDHHETSTGRATGLESKIEASKQIDQLSIVERTKLEQHPTPDAMLHTKTGESNPVKHNMVTQQGVTYPPIDSLLSGKYNVTGNISFLVNFAIIGFPKCGTSTMMEYLDKSPYTAVAQKERCFLGTGRQARLVRELYSELPEGNYQRGIKCPRDLENDYAMEQYNKYFPGVNILVGMRHPILWLQSFYNFRVYNKNPMPAVETLVGPCFKLSRHVCTHRARFHQYLANLGKTPLGPQERTFFSQGGRELRVTPVKGKIFLYHVEQLRMDEPVERQLSLRRDLSSFLDLPEMLPPISIWTKPGKNLTEEQREDADRRRLDICHENHTHVRTYLMKQSTVAAQSFSGTFEVMGSRSMHQRKCH